MQQGQVDKFNLGWKRIEDGQADFGHITLNPLEGHHARVTALPAKLNGGEEEDAGILFVMSRIFVSARLEV